MRRTYEPPQPRASAWKRTGVRRKTDPQTGTEVLENAVIRGVHAVAERANALLKITFKALHRVSLDPAAITRIARAALVLLQLRTRPHYLNEDHRTSQDVTETGSVAEARRPWTLR
jgi:hypothetical protein